MVCFNVLELLLDETAMPRGMEVSKEQEVFMPDARQPAPVAHR